MFERVGSSSRTVAVGVSFFTLLSIGCSTATPTTISDVWRDPSFAAGPMKNLVVFGGRVNATDRRTLEDGFVAALSTHGVRATASYTLFADELPSRDQARAVMHDAGVDGVIVASMMGVNEKQTYVPGGYDVGFWNGYYGPGWGATSDPGYVVTDQFVKFETSLWDPNGNGRLVWSAVTQTENPSSGRDFASSLTKSVVPAMTRAGFLPPASLGARVLSAVPSQATEH
jgi:hypothetical protein